MTKRAVFIGRFSPFHNGHFSIMKKKIDEGRPLLILIRDTNYDIYPPEIRKLMIESVMAKNDINAKVMIIDDIESVNYGRGVGYEINEIEVDENLKQISATNIRNMIENNSEEWKDIVPEEVIKVLEYYHSNNVSKKNIFWENSQITKEDRIRLLNSKGKVIWLTGLSGSGKSTIAKVLEKRLHNSGIQSYILDGDNIRHGLNKDLEFTKEDREENIRRTAEVAKLMYDAGLTVIVALISPFNKSRNTARELIGDDFIEVFVNCSLEECERRDTKNLYAKARSGKIKDFTGIDSPYEKPENPEIILNTEEMSVDECVETLIEFIKFEIP